MALRLARPGLLLRCTGERLRLRGSWGSRNALALPPLRRSAGTWSASSVDTVPAVAATSPLQVGAEQLPAIVGADNTAFIISESPSHARFVNMLMKDGKKQTARRVLNGAFDLLRRNGHDPQKIFFTALENARPVLEMKTMSKLQVPYPLGPRRAEGQAMKWIINAARKRGSKGGMSARLQQELLQAAEFKGSAVGRREAVHAAAMANQAAAHFRWRGSSDKAVGAVDMDRKSFRPHGVRAIKRYQGPMRAVD